MGKFNIESTYFRSRRYLTYFISIFKGQYVKETINF